jgi:5-methylthioadenosine/S-adenosylhomocysteine deaminase
MTNAFAIIRNGRLVDARRRLAEPADILIKGDAILSMGPPRTGRAPEDAELIDASDRALTPGLVNAHVHGHGTLAKGLVGDCWPLELFLNVPRWSIGCGHHPAARCREPHQAPRTER